MEYAQPQISHQSAPIERSCELFIRDYPFRSIAIASSSHALILRYSHVGSSANDASINGSHPNAPRDRTAAGGSIPAKCMVEFSAITDDLLKDYRPLSPQPIYGTLGLMSAQNEVFLSVITHATRVATVRPGESVERILGVAFYCLSSDDYDDVVPLEALDSDSASRMSMDTYESAQTHSSQIGGPYGQGLSRRDVALQHPCHDLRQLLGNGTFYYSTSFDLTNRVQDRPLNSVSFEIDNFDEQFLWNSFMISPLVEFRSKLMPQKREALDASRILTSAIRGFCQTMTIPLSASPLKAAKSGRPSYLTLISRLSCRRAGTRFNARGIDDDGNVANFVESETVFWNPSGTLFSYSQVRGSVPVFWEQAADLVPGRQKITVTRGPEGAQPAFNKHFEDLEHAYGAVHVVNLLSNEKPSEVELSTLYSRGIKHSPLAHPGVSGGSDHALLRATHYDFHAETRGPSGYAAAQDIRRLIEHSADGFAYYLAEATDDTPEDQARIVGILQQEGVFRTNCLDCLDRTNLIQTVISQMAMETFLAQRGAHATSDFWMRHSSLWADNGDSLSKTYAGTGALKSSFTRSGKMSLAGVFADARKSVQRIYHNNFVDPSRQVTIDMLLGRNVGQVPVHLLDPISDYVSVELGKRSEEFTSFKNITMWVGTFNLNGRTNGIDSDLSPWLFPRSLGDAQPELYVVGFQEIVELSPQQIMNSDPSRKQLWEQAVKKNLNRRQASLGGEKYVLLRSGQLVGAALCIFVKSSALAKIKNVEGSVKKTGMSGIAGNKGAVAIRFDYANTQICFVTAHLAAGFANYDERNRDYKTIAQGLKFQRGRSIEDHDAIVWLGDFNYRIGLGWETTRGLVKQRNLERLYENDQLNLQMVAGLAFSFYSEARINFLPTYKFDLGTDEYDSSEKARIPAWTDRILRKGANLRQLTYDSAPLRFSDHRPVYATFECRVSIIDEACRDAISRQVYASRKADVGEEGTHVDLMDDSDEEDLIGYDAIEPGLPPASSDKQKWWLDNKQPARSKVTAPTGPDGQSMMLNPNRPSNPFGQAEEHDWISVPRSSSKTSLSSISSSPYDKIQMPPSLQSSTPSARKLPPAFNSNQLPGQMGHMKLDDSRSSRDHDGAASATPPPPPPRRQGGGMPATASNPAQGSLHRAMTEPSSSPGASSTGSWNQRAKPAPPIARKPAHLSGVSAAASGPIRMVSRDGDDDAKPPLPTRSMTGSAMPSGAVRMPGMEARAPTLPTRKPVGGPSPRTAQPASQGPMDDLLLGDDGGGMGGWETLQPTKR